MKSIVDRVAIRNGRRQCALTRRAPRLALRLSGEGKVASTPRPGADTCTEGSYIDESRRYKLVRKLGVELWYVRDGYWCIRWRPGMCEVHVHQVYTERRYRDMVAIDSHKARPAL